MFMYTFGTYICRSQQDLYCPIRYMYIRAQQFYRLAILKNTSMIEGFHQPTYMYHACIETP